MEKKVCSICGKEYEGWGNNAWPVNNGECCDQCNSSCVIPARILDIKAKKVVECLNFEEVEEGIAQLRGYRTAGLISEELYDHIIKNWDRLVLNN